MDRCRDFVLEHVPRLLPLVGLLWRVGEVRKRAEAETLENLMFANANL